MSIDLKPISTSIGKHLGSATKSLGQGMEDHPLPTGAIVGAAAAGLGTYKLAKYLKRKWDERSLNSSAISDTENDKPTKGKTEKVFYDTKDIENW